ncbi:MFS transporter, partial [Streptococcus pneumoniae]|uniref:MFS transporter n=1 Tax=Streptococcus pneumoniae TaxID=1313 RepID=UPI001CB7724C
FVTRPFTGKIYDHFGENKVMYPVLLSFAIGLAILSIVSSPFLLLLSAAFIGFGYGTIVPTAQAIAIQQSPTSKMGLATSTFYIFVTRPFTGKIYDHFGENKVMYPVLLSFAIGLAI